MYRKILVTGVTAAAIVGVGGAALATTGSTTTSGQPSSPSSTSAAKPGHHGDHKGGKGGKGGKLHKNLLHGQVVTKGKDGVVTRDLINGTVTSVSATSITVQAADKKSETFSVGKATKVLAKSATGAAKPAKTTISKVAKGDHVFVAGTGTTTFAAKHIVDLGKN